MLADTLPSAIIKINPSAIDFDYEKEIACTEYKMDPSLIPQLNDVRVMIYSAAEDGFYKAVMLTIENIFSDAKAIQLENSIDPQSVVCALLPSTICTAFRTA